MTHYFSPEDHPTSQVRSFTLRLGDRAFQATTDSGVFSTAKLDPGTKALLDVVPSPPHEGTFLDLGCGWGPLTMALAAASPTARVVGVDVNPRAVELTNSNLKANKLTNARAHMVEDLLSSEPGFEFELMWSNPPIRVGKKVLHEIMRTWLPRMSPTGTAFLVVSRNLGGDSLHRWLQTEMGYAVQRFASKRGYRILQVQPPASAQ